MWTLFARIAVSGASIFASAEVLKFLTRDQNYLDVVSLIAKEVNNAFCKAEQKRKGGLGLSCDVYSPKVFSEEKVKIILNIYIQLMLDNASLPEYDARSAEKLAASAPTIAQVSAIAGEQDEMTVRNILGQLFWSTEQQRVTDTSYIRPRTARDNEKYRATPDQYKDQKGLTDTVMGYVETAATVIIAGIVIYAGVEIYNASKQQ
jgi:hypothetical protein